ncbi:MAG TPA: metalloregulator ArsR/SmtB family transcription factor [Candidatus Cloacimonadota bacterium]|nr:metalloregulator ArsR/SmtB family transcription factor [Candidatus Cloacimonadota bacterium]
MKIENVTEIFKALGDRSRLLVVRSLVEKPQYLEELAERLNLAVSTVSFHLKKLENAGLVWKEKQQYYTIFSIKKELFEKTLEEMMDFAIDEREEQEKRIDDYKQKILKTFMKNGKITQIPAQKQKRWIVFEQILNEFEFGKEYTEQEVNELVQKYHEDYCLIRRTFIEERVMKRENNVYTITENYEDFRSGKDSASIKHGLKESYEQSIRDKFGVI